MRATRKRLLIGRKRLLIGRKLEHLDDFELAQKPRLRSSGRGILLGIAFPPSPLTMRVVLPSFSLLVPILVALLPFAAALYRDEAYRIDFQHALLGAPLPHNTFFHQPNAASKASLLYTLSEKLILGAVNPKDGALVWRQDLAEGAEDRRRYKSFLKAVQGTGAVVSAAGESVRAWDAAGGRLLWEWVGKGTVKSLEVLDWDGESNGALVVTHEGGRDRASRLARIRSETGETIWEVEQSMYRGPFHVLRREALAEWANDVLPEAIYRLPLRRQSPSSSSTFLWFQAP